MAENIAEMQDFISKLADGQLSADPVFGPFKRQDIEGTLTAATKGKFAEYWTVDKLGDFNNIVDQTPNCDDSVKAIFTGSRNPGLRARKMGRLVLERVKEMMEQGVPDSPTTLSSSFSHSVQVRDIPASNPGTPTPQHPHGQPKSPLHHTKAGLMPNNATPFSTPRVFQINPELGDDCQIWVRSAPSMDAQAHGVVTAADDIYAIAELENWLKVEIPGSGFVGDAWMMRTMGDRALLVACDNSPSDHVPSSTVAHASDPYQNSSLASSRREGGLLDISSSHSVQYNNFVGSPARSIADNGANPLSQSLQVTGTGPQFVPYAAYQALEARVSQLEQQLRQLVTHLRNI